MSWKPISLQAKYFGPVVMADGRDSPDGQQRQKIQIRPIMEARKRQVTFMKRKKGLIKKAKELAILCGADLSVILFNPAGQMFEFSSGNMVRPSSSCGLKTG